jgi:hypothetical protein
MTINELGILHVNPRRTINQLSGVVDPDPEGSEDFCL